MELSGDEKRIQALFSELALENQNRMPEFAHLWTRAEAIQESAFRRAFAPLREKNLIGAMAVLVSLFVTAAAYSLVALTWDQSNQTPNIASVTFEEPYTLKRETLQPAKIQPRSQKHIVRRRQVDRIATEAALLSNWQSPTQRFMASPTDLALGSLPVLNQSAKDLESFLSKNSEIMKESNR
jgi:hypothetical protein